ncbi:MAG: hypothetical protein A2V98_06540 [Planctomycetes bacterium RBG_16_64_12]|nr:MAG: hypothetical protein A2V98_06540 [Planctomycetes bacterium RBG_16_64_12]
MTEITRRTFVKDSVLASGGAALALGTVAPAASASPPAGKEALAKGKIGGLEVSRLILGGSPLQHYVHCRDLRFVASLMAHYNTPKRVLQTLALAEQQGINTLVCHPSGPAGNTVAVLKQHREKHGGKMQWIIAPLDPIEPGLAKYGEQVRKLVDAGADAVYVWGVQTDALVDQGKLDLIGEAVDLGKAQGIPCGVAAHDLRVVQECEKNKIAADFYIKTFHHHKYPSAKLNYDSMWCSNPEETVEFMQGVQKPWIAFKVLAAGAIPPQDAFRYAFENGADFILAGMYDFEIAEDVQIVNATLASLPHRIRAWRG